MPDDQSHFEESGIDQPDSQWTVPVDQSSFGRIRRPSRVPYGLRALFVAVRALFQSRGLIRQEVRVAGGFVCE